MMDKLYTKPQQRLLSYIVVGVGILCFLSFVNVAIGFAKAVL